MVRRAHVIRARRGGWRIWTFYQCPVVPCSAKRTQKRGGDPIFKDEAEARNAATEINKVT